MKIGILVLLALWFVSGCKTGDSSNAKDVEDIGRMSAHSTQPGQFLVVCKYHTYYDEPEVRSAEEIRNNQVCTEGSGGMSSGCTYNGTTGLSGTFTVIAEDQLYTKTVDGYDNAKVFCRRNLATLYDGDDLYSFNFETKQFNTNFSVKDLANVIMTGTDKMVMVYDGDNIFVHDLEADANGWNKNHSVEDNAAIFRYRLKERALLVYDGDDYHSYCKGNWKQSYAVNDNDSSIQINISGNLIFSGRYSVNANTCETN